MALTVSILRQAPSRYFNCDTTNGGISAAERGACGLTLMNVDGPDREPNDDYPPALLVPHLCFGPDQGRRLARIVPAVLVAGEWKPDPRWAMFGGNYAATSDGRFWQALRGILELEHVNGAVPIHDRFE